MLDISRGYKISYDTLLKDSISKINDITDGEHSIEVAGIKIKNNVEMMEFLDKYADVFDGTTPASIKLKVRLIDFLIFQDIYHIRYIKLSEDGFKKYTVDSEKK